MSPEPPVYRSLSRQRPAATEARLDSLISWLLAFLVVTIGLVMALKPQERERKREQIRPRRAPPRASPAQEPLAAQEARATERGRGRKARAPSRIPWRGWRDIVVRSYFETVDDRLFALAAGVAFYSLVALFPAIAAGVSFYALFADAGTIARHLSLAAGIVPADVLDILGTEIARIAGKSDGRLTLGFVLGISVALWSANAGMKAIFDALNVIYDEREKRSLVRLNLTSLLFTIAAIAVAVLAAAAVVIFPLVLAGFSQSVVDRPIIGYLRWPALFALLIVGLAVLYRYGPSRRPAKWRWISVGSVFAALAWLAVSSLLSWYLGNFANYNATYGALSTVVALMMWMWLSAIVVLTGAQLNAEIEHQTARDSTVGPERPLGIRGAVMADTVGAAQT
jgi:membrane protein